MSQTYRVHGIILKTQPCRESDKTLLIFTKERGKLRLLAKGARKIKSKLGGSLEPPHEVYLMVAEGRSQDVVCEVELLNPRARIKKDLLRLGYFFYISELVHQCLPEGQTARHVYELLKSAVAELENKPQDALDCTRAAFGVRLVKILGLFPQLKMCVLCQHPLSAGGSQMIEKPKGVFLSFNHGGVLCETCASPRESGISLSPKEAQMFHALAYQPSTINSQSNLSSNLLQAIDFYVQYIFEAPVRSLSFLKCVKNGNLLTDSNR